MAYRCTCSCYGDMHVYKCCHSDGLNNCMIRAAYDHSLHIHFNIIPYPSLSPFSNFFPPSMILLKVYQMNIFSHLCWMLWQTRLLVTLA